MTPDSREHFDAVDRLLDRLLDAPPSERGALLEQMQHDNPPAAARVEALLRAVESNDGFLARPAHQRAARLLDALLAESQHVPDEGPLPVTRVGPYRLVREIGRGGMGAVYLAERDDAEFRLLVAIKLLPRELGTERAILRFRDERRILASLTHPNIARLLDGGVEGGLPWYAMEYIHGTPIDSYCDEHHLPVDTRLELFCQACDAVQYAHGNLVVHRDLKPSNILVDEDATIKLLDFGIAQLTADAPGEAQSLVPGPLMMTPEYASPEQLRGEPVSTASDIYSLGVLLHELLVGRRPHDIPDREPDAMIQAILQAPDSSPSTTLSGLAPDEQDNLGRVRRTSAVRLRRRLRGDLDAIVLKATRLDGHRRYGTAEQLAADVRAHLAGLPVGARDGTAGYRLAKFVKRHGAGVTVAAVMLLLLLGFSGILAVQSRRIALERDKARQVATFMTSLFEATDPYDGSGVAISAREVLDQGAARIMRDLADQPALQAEMMSVMAQSYSGLGAYGESRQLAESVLVIQRQTLGDNHPEVVGTLTVLAHAMLGEGDYADAAELLRQSLAVRRAIWGRDHPYVARTMNVLAQSLRMLGSHDQAESLLREALEIDRRHIGSDGEDVAQSLRGLAHLLRDRGDYSAAEPLYREAHSLHLQRLGEESPETANSLINHALILAAQGDPATAEPMLRQGLTTKRRAFGEIHSDVATDMVSLAGVLHQLQQDSAAEDLYRNALVIHRATRPGQHPRTATALLGLGRLLVDRNEIAAADPILREALEIRQRSLPAGHWEIAQATSLLGVCALRAGRPLEALELLQSGHAGLLSALGAEHPETRAAAQRLHSLTTVSSSPD